MRPPIGQLTWIMGHIEDSLCMSSFCWSKHAVPFRLILFAITPAACNQRQPACCFLEHFFRERLLTVFTTCFCQNNKGVDTWRNAKTTWDKSWLWVCEELFFEKFEEWNDLNPPARSVDNSHFSYCVVRMAWWRPTLMAPLIWLLSSHNHEWLWNSTSLWSSPNAVCRLLKGFSKDT